MSLVTLNIDACVWHCHIYLATSERKLMGTRTP